MKKKVDQFFIENFRSWSGRNYFDLNSINFLFGSNSSGKSSVIHALSLIKQSLSNDTFEDYNSIRHLRPVGEFTDLGPIRNQAFSIVKNKKLLISDEICFGYRIKDIDNFLKSLTRNHPFDKRSSVIDDYKNMKLFKGIKEIIISYIFLSSTGELKSIGLNIDDEKIFKIYSDKNKILVDLPKDETFWRKNLGVNKIPKGEGFYEFLNTHAFGAEEISNFNQTELYLKTQSELAEVDNKINKSDKEFNRAQENNILIREVLKIRTIIKNKCKYRYEKNKDKILKYLPNLTRQKNLSADIFMNGPDLYELFKENEVKILEAYKSAEDSSNFDSEFKNNIILTRELIDQLTTLQRLILQVYDNLSKMNLDDKLFDLDYAQLLTKIINGLQEAKILNFNETKFNSFDNIEIEQNGIFFYFEITMLLFGLQKNLNFEIQLQNLRPKVVQEQFKIKDEIINLQKQKEFYKTRLKEIEDQTAKFDKLIGKQTISFQDFIELINKGPISIFNTEREDLSLTHAILRLSRRGIPSPRERQDGKNDSLKLKIPFFINNNSILPNSSIFIVMRELQSIFFRNFRNIRVIGPHRRRPNRIELINPFDLSNNVGVEGQNILNILRNANKKDLDQLNKRLKALEIPYSVSTQFSEEDNSIKVLVKDFNGLITSLADVGYGVGQILPIVLECVLSKGKLLTIEQPELHLHPKLQANLTDLIIWSAQENKNRFILETHSEHMILRLKRRLRENFEKKDQNDPKIESLTTDVTINVVTTNENESKSQNSLLKLTPSGNFNGDWPEGFFEERFVELGLD